MAKQFFKDLPDTSTPLNASRLNGLLDGEEAMGNLVVDSIKSKNMIDKSTIVAGSIDGTSTDTRLNTRQVLWLPAGTYTCSCDNITSPFRYGIQVQNIGVPPLSTWPSSFIYDSGWKTDMSFTFTTTDAGWCTLMISKENNATLTPSEVSDFNFQLEEGSATTYSPYQELDINNLKNKELVVGSIRSKNMFDMNKLVLHNCTFTSNNNSFTLTGTNGYGSYDTSLKGGTYTISGNITGDIDYIDVYINGNFSRRTLPYTFTLSSTSTLGLVLYSSNTYTDFQLEKGSTATTYSPYQELDNKDIYTTGESIIGTWVDGKPIYRKVVVWPQTDYIASNTQKTKAHQISNLNEIIKCDAIAKWNNLFLPLPTHYQTISKSVAINYIDSSNIYFTSYDDNWGATTIYFILEYTKTTD